MAAAGLAWGLLLAGCGTPRPDTPPARAPTAPGPDDAQAALQAWARVLRRFVNARGEVYFHALAQQRDDLDLYLRHVARTPLDGPSSPHERMAHLINAYNALSMAHVIDSGFPSHHDGLNKLRFFVLSRHDIGGERRSLYGLENDVIRPLGRSLQDPRLHFALNCSALACPVLPRQPFSAASLDQELEREALAFFARPENLRTDHAARTVWLSEILDFYREDFTPRPAASLIAYANRYASTPAPLDYALRFTPYDWTVAYAQ